MIVKKIAKKFDINDPQNGTLSRYVSKKCLQKMSYTIYTLENVFFKSFFVKILKILNRIYTFSYSINLMLIHYLQTLEIPILPSIQQLEKEITMSVSLKALPQLIRCLPQVYG